MAIGGGSPSRKFNKSMTYFIYSPLSTCRQVIWYYLLAKNLSIIHGNSWNQLSDPFKAVATFAVLSVKLLTLYMINKIFSLFLCCPGSFFVKSLAFYFSVTFWFVYLLCFCSYLNLISRLPNILIHCWFLNI